MRFWPLPLPRLTGLTRWWPRSRRPRPTVHPLGRLLQLWLFALLIPIGVVVGFTVTTDASGLFGINRFGGYAADELFLKNALMRHRDHDALLMGDSRAAFIDPGMAEGFSFFNAGVGGAGYPDVAALLDRADLSTVSLVVMMLPLGDLATGCETGQSRINDWRNWGREALTFDAFGAALDHIRHRLRGDIPGHKPDGTRYPDARVLVPMNWDGGRTAQYNQDVQGSSDSPLHTAFAQSGFCTATLIRLQAEMANRGTELLVLLPPINGDILDRSGTDRAALASVIEERLIADAPFVIDLSMSVYSDPGYFPPADAIHFRPDIGPMLLQHAIDQYCLVPGHCQWRG